MLTKTNLKALRMADQFVFTTEGGESFLRCIKKGSRDENEPFTQPDVHHDIACASHFPAEDVRDVTIEVEQDVVVETVLNNLKEGDDITLIWQALAAESGQWMLSLSVRRKEKLMQFILTVQAQSQLLKNVA